MNEAVFRIYIFFILLLFTSATIAAKQQPAATPAEKATIDTLNNRGYKLIRNNAAQALLMFTKAEQLSVKSHYYKGLATAYVNQAEVFSQRGYAKRALILYYQAMNVSQRNNDEYHIAQCEQHISTVKRNSGDYAEARRLLDHSLAVYTKYNKPVDIVNAQLRLGLLSVEQKRYAEASQWYIKAYLTSKKAGFSYGEKKTHYDRGLLAEKLRHYDDALVYFNRALVIDTLTHDLYGKSLSYLEIGRVYLNKHELSAALQYAGAAYRNADSVSAMDLTMQAARLQIDVYTAMNNPKGIIEWQNRALKINQQVSDQEKKDAVTFIDVLREQQENQVRYLKQIDNIQKVSREKTIFLISFLIILVIVVLLIFPLNYNYRKAMAYAQELKIKNQQVIDKSFAVEQLNSQVISQNKSLEEDNRLKNKLLSVISHDLRHPLVNTRSLLQLYNQQLMSPDEARDLFSQLEAQYARTITLLDNLLFWIKRQVQHEPAAKTMNNVAQLVADLAEEQKLALYNKRITVVNQVSSAIEWFADREALRIVFRNLLNNALKFTPDNGQIEFISTITPESTSITVKDNGVGMGPSKLKKVIQGSYLSTSGTAGEMGSGFGLILVRDLISQYQGTLDITSTVGTGSEFTITFPNEAVSAAA